MSDDAQLLRDYAETRSEAAFAELVRRHVNLVHSAALRQVNGDAHLAQDVTQLVFADLARKAGEVARHRVLAGWLFTSTRFASAKLVRGERRRQAREWEAHTMNEMLGETTAKVDWERVRPVLDETLAELAEADREAILLRYFEGRDFADIGERLSLSGNAARMRVERALDKLHGLLARRGVKSSAAALAVALGGHAVAAAPVGLAATVTGVALASGGAVAAGTAAGGVWVTFMSMSKLQLGISGALAVAGATGLAVQAQTNAQLRSEVAALRQDYSQMETLRAENARLARAAAEVAEMRGDGVVLSSLQSEAAGLNARAQTVAQATARAKAKLVAANTGALSVIEAEAQPRPRVQTRPKYPQALRDAGITGTVVVQLIVDTSGNAQNVAADTTVLEGIDKGVDRTGRPVNLEEARTLLSDAAVEAVSQWKFDPVQKNGRAVNSVLKVPIRFETK